MAEGGIAIPGNSGASSAGQCDRSQSVRCLAKMDVTVIYSLIGPCQPEGCAVTRFMFVFRNPQPLTAAPPSVSSNVVTTHIHHSSTV